MSGNAAACHRHAPIGVGSLLILLLSSCAVGNDIVAAIGDTAVAALPNLRPQTQTGSIGAADLLSPSVTVGGYAKRIENGGEDANTTLRSVLAASGIPIRLDNGFLVPGASPQAEAPWQQWQIDAVVSAMKAQSTISLSEAGDIIEKYAFASAAAPGSFGHLLIDGVREAAQSQSPTDRFWAQFVDAIGGEGSLLNGQGDLDKRITNVQLGLILTRLTARLQALSTHGTVRSRSENTSQQATFRPVQANAGPSLPGCYYGTGQSEAAPDAAALLQTSGFTTLIEYLKEHLVRESETAFVETLSLQVDVINALAALAKLAIVYSSITEITVELSGDGPLVRTKHTYEFEQKRVLRAEMRSNTGSLQFLSCFRLVMDTMGVDVDIPKDGPVAGAIIQWRLLKGGISGMTLDPNERIVDFFQTPKSKEEMRRSPDAAFLANFVSNSRTDDEGRAEIGVEGYPQKEEVPDKASAVKKDVSVQLNVAYQRQSLLKATVSGGGVAIGGLVSRSPIAVLTSIVPELFLGSRWKQSQVFHFTVIDWGLPGYKFDVTSVLHLHSFYQGVGFVGIGDEMVQALDGVVCPIPDSLTTAGLHWLVIANLHFVEKMRIIPGRESTTIGDGRWAQYTQYPPLTGWLFTMIEGDTPRLEFKWVTDPGRKDHVQTDGPNIIPLMPSSDCSSLRDIPATPEFSFRPG